MTYDEGASFKARTKESDLGIFRLQGVTANCEKEGNALMQAKEQRETRQSPQSWGNLALADESLGVLQKPKAKTRSPQLRLAQDRTEEESEIEALAPTMGMINGIRLSLTLGSIFGVIILLIRELLAF